MLRLFTLTIIGVFLTYASAIDEKFITGKIIYTGPTVVDKSLRIEIVLRDVAVSDVTLKPISSIIISDAKTFPVPYTLKYNPSDIQSHRTYALFVKITGHDGKLLYTNDVQTRVLLTGPTPPVTDIVVIRVGEKCVPVQCHGKPKNCRYGYEKKDGCEICKCFDPCKPSGKPFHCESNERCHVEKKPDGIFEARCEKIPSKREVEKIDPETICKLPKELGTCKASMKRYFFNPVTKTCEMFLYTGCDGNENNFRTEDECKKTCHI